VAVIVDNLIRMNLFTGAREGSQELYISITLKMRTNELDLRSKSRLLDWEDSEIRKFGMSARNALRGGRSPRGVIISRKEWLQRVSGDMTDWELYNYFTMDDSERLLLLNFIVGLPELQYDRIQGWYIIGVDL